MTNKFIYVYQTICETNGKSYIGVHRTNNLNDGYIGCGVFSISGARYNFMFHRAVRKYGYDSFRRHILSFYDTYAEALDEEKFLVSTNWVKSKDNYNSAIGGKGNTMSWMDSEKRDEIRKRIGDSNRGKKKSKESILRTIGNRAWYKHSKETKKKISESHKGIPLSQSHKDALVKSNSRYWLGKKRSDETKQKLSLSHTGKILSAEHRKKMSDAHMGKVSGNRKAVLQMDLSGNVINEYESIYAAGAAINCWHTSVNNNLSGRTKVVDKKYTFKYKEV